LLPSLPPDINVPKQQHRKVIRTRTLIYMEPQAAIERGDAIPVPGKYAAAD
jgi:hypothetical protein